MNVHKNAKWAPAGRAELVRRVLEGGRIQAVAEQMGVSRETARKWVNRYRAEGEPVGIWLRRPGLGRLRDLEPKPIVVRYEKQRPGELLHLDTKKLGRIQRIGHRIHGNRRKRSRGVGWEVLHVCIDDATRVAYAEVLPDERAVTATAFLERAVAWFRERDVFVERVMTDNGSCYVSHRFRRTLEALGVRHTRTRPYRPQTNGKAERFIQTAKREWAYARAYRTSLVRTQALSGFLNRYNGRRPHRGIGRQTPLSRLDALR